MTGWELPNKIGPWVCLVNGAVALVLVAVLVASMPELAADQNITEHPWLGTWMRATAVLALLMPGSTLMLWRSCPVVPLPKDAWPKGDATPLRQRVKRGAPRGAKLALLGLVVHGLGMLALLVVVLVAAGGL
ncbi:hypothetical protein Pla163_28040 [Planctomycetes bacterium Pla163]|uniref:Uncharacterized protein n=1 Tax=Rohdeia mirabilis TaxID=2528008 RepID=A0A518D2H0_9BACT|nr:hypothetical protein Pla163_28040 [Planctomycetes bacterium Pla163]